MKPVIIHPRIRRIPEILSGRPAVSSCGALLVLLAATASAPAQSAANFEVPGVSGDAAESPSAAEGGQAASQPKKVLGPASLTPSRYVTPEDRDAYVSSMYASLLITNHATDSFGQFQDPNAKPVIRKAVKKAPRRAPVYKPTAFSDIVSLIRVSTVMPAEDKFLIGDREIRLGQQIPVSFRGKEMKIEVVGVSSEEVRFRNIETGESAPLKLNLLPPGMSPGVGGLMTAPGMVPQDSRAPIRLEGDLPGPESSQNR